MILDIIIGWLSSGQPVKKKLSYEEIIEYSHNCGVILGNTYTYKGTKYQVCEIALQAGVNETTWQVIYYPVNNLLVRFSRELEDFKTKFTEI